MYRVQYGDNTLYFNSAPQTKNFLDTLAWLRHPSYAEDEVQCIKIWLMYHQVKGQNIQEVFGYMCTHFGITILVKCI